MSPLTLSGGQRAVTEIRILHQDHLQRGGVTGSDPSWWQTGTHGLHVL